MKPALAQAYMTTAETFAQLSYAKRLIGAGIKKVYYRDTYRDMAGVDYLHRAGIERI